MEKKDVRIGMVVGPRPTEVIKLQGNKVKVRPFGESARWVKISDLTEIDKDTKKEE